MPTINAPPHHEFPLVSLDEVVDHATSQRGVLAGPAAWWKAVHAGLARPDDLSATHRPLLPGDVDRALRTGDADEIAQAWCEAPLLCDRLWTVAVHCPIDRNLVGHLVLAAAQGSPRRVTETLCHDLMRISAIDVPRWGGPAAAARRVDQATALADRVGVGLCPAVVLADTEPTSFAVNAVVRRGVRHGAAALTSVVTSLAVGEVLIVDVLGSHDRLAVQVMRRVDSLTLEGQELVSGAPCTLHPHAEGWEITTRPADTPRSAGRDAHATG